MAAPNTRNWLRYTVFVVLLTPALAGMSTLWRGVPTGIGGWIDLAMLPLLFTAGYLAVGIFIRRARVRLAEERAGLHSGWRPCPFEVGSRYRPVTNFQSHRDAFEIGEPLTFVRMAYSPHDGMTGFFFEDSHGRLRSWDIDDNADLATHRDLFEQIAAP